MNSEYIKKIQSLWLEVVEGKKKLDPVDSKALKKDYDDRKDKDLDNDGDTDSSDEYLHNRRKTIAKAMKKEDTDLEEATGKDIAAKMMRSKTMKPFASKVAKMAKVSAGDLEKMLPDYVSGGEIRKLFEESVNEEVWKEIETYAKKHGGIDKNDMMKVAMMLKKGDRKGAVKYARGLDTDPRDWLLDKMDEAVELDEVSAKLARKAAASSAAKSFEYGSSAYGPGSDKETDRLDKKADKARAHVQKRQGDKGVKKVDRMTGKLIYGRNESVNLDDLIDNLSEEQLDEISAKLARKAAAASQAKSFEYGSSAYGPGADKETDRLDKKADKARAHVQKRQGDKGVKKVDRMTGKLIYGRNEAVDISTKSVDKALSHDCAKHVASEQWGFGECIPGQHTLVEQSDGTAIVTHYDVMFEHGVEFDVPVEDLTILVSESHKHTAKKMKEGDMSKDKASHDTGGFRISNQDAQAAKKRLADRLKQRRMKKEGVEEGKTYGERTKGAAKAETMKDKFKGKAALDMAKDANMDNPELAADDAKGHEDATKAGRAVKGQAPMRPGETRVGDKNIVNPVKGAVTRTTGKEG